VCSQVEEVSDTPSFVFLWCGSGEGLEHGRRCLDKWGFRRVEDIVWLKTNKTTKSQSPSAAVDSTHVLQHTKEHCLVGIKVRSAPSSRLFMRSRRYQHSKQR
jgi:N6-adenosine-specific RNA methylase IME4